MRSFERLARIRAIWERRERVRLGDARRAVAEAGARLEAAEEAHGESIHPDPTPMSSARLHLLRAQALATHESLLEASTARLHAEQRASAAQGVWRRSAQELEMAEELEARRRLSLAYEARRASERSLDELMALRTRRKR